MQLKTKLKTNMKIGSSLLIFTKELGNISCLYFSRVDHLFNLRFFFELWP